MATTDTTTVSHLRFDASRTYTGRYRHWFYRQHADQITGRVLDLGSGGDQWNADQYDHLTDVAEYITLDIDRDPSLDIHADGTQLPLQDETFDTVILSAVLEHIPVSQLPDLLREARRVLRPGGRLIAGVPHQYPLHSEPNDYWRPTVFGITDLLNDAGFEPVHTYQGGSYSEVLLHTLFYPVRAILLYIGLRQLAWAFAPAHYLVVGLATLLSRALYGVYGENPFGSRWYLQNFVIATTEHP